MRILQDQLEAAPQSKILIRALMEHKIKRDTSPSGLSSEIKKCGNKSLKFIMHSSDSKNRKNKLVLEDILVIGVI